MADIINLFGEAVDESVVESKRTFGSRFVEKAGAEEDEEYIAFTEKFKPKKTTDDCYTPAPVYEAVKSWAVKEYGLEGRPIIRPFFPGKDYQRETYPADCVVIDNPPFSILSEIVRFYMVKGVDFFLFAPTLILYSVACGACNYLPTGKNVTYENGADVATSFVTNMGEWKIDANAELAKALADANEAGKPKKKTQAKVSLPDEVNTASRCYVLPMRGQTFRAKPEEVAFVSKLDEMAKNGRRIFGGGFIMNEDATARYVAARERAERERAVFCYRLSERERAFVAKKKEGGEE